MAGFELQISGVKGNHSTNRAQLSNIFFNFDYAIKDLFKGQEWSTAKFGCQYLKIWCSYDNQ